MKFKDIILALIGLLISFFLIYLTFRNIDFKKTITILLSCDFRFIFLFIISIFFEIVFRTLKWYLIILPNFKVNFTDLFKFEVIGLGINNILPFRMGEITKMLLVAKFYSASKTVVLSTIFVERILDSLILFILLLFYSKIGGINIIINANFVFIVLNIIIIVILFGFRYSDIILNINYFKNFEKKHPKIHSVILKIRMGGVCFKNIGLTILILFIGVVQWNFDVLNNFFIAKSLDIREIDYFRAAITVFVGSLATSIPSMPGYFGNYEYAISRVCMSWSIDENLSIIFPTAVHILSYLIITISAVVFIYSLGFNLRRIINISKLEN